jgi:putative ABC transport system permease protein
MWTVTFLMALRAIRRNTLRSVLTTLGIVIGVASVIAMVTLGQSASARVTNEISSLGTNMLIIAPGADRRGPVSVSATAFDMSDVRAISQEIPDLAGLAPVTSRGVLAVYGSANYNTIANGSTNDFFRVRNFRINAGRDFSEPEGTAGTPVCILGETVKRELFAAQNPLGATIRLGSVACNVIGVIESKGKSTFGQDQDDFLVMPIRAVQRRLAGNTDVGMMFAAVADEAALTRTKTQLEAVLQERRRLQPGQKNDFSVEDTREIAKTVGNVTGILTALLGAVAAVSLLVGGIGIMNIMLVSVTERTREIGIRLAIGALGREVLLQFLVESILLCAIGGALGVILGLGGSLLAARALGFPFAVDLAIVGVALAFSAAFGIVFGFIPARKAARMNPIEALRHE